MSETIRRSIGAVLGAALGTLAYWLMLQRGIHILAAVGAATALGVSSTSRTRSPAWAVVTMILAVTSSLLVEFAFRPFSADPSLGYFLAHVGDLPRNSLVSLLVAAMMGLYFGRGRAPRRADPA